MYNIGSETLMRMSSGLKRLCPVIKSAKMRDINENDTVSIVKDILAEVWGYDKYLEVTSEYKIRDRYNDLAVQLSGKVQFVIEVKAVGVDLENHHLKQVVDYAAHEGIDWVVLTNARHWQLHKIHFDGGLQCRQIFAFDITDLAKHIENAFQDVYAFSREGVLSNSFVALEHRYNAKSEFMVSAVLFSKPVLNSICSEIHKMCTQFSASSNSVGVREEDICKVLRAKVLKRSILDSQEFTFSQNLVNTMQAANTEKKANLAQWRITQSTLQSIVQRSAKSSQKEPASPHYDMVDLDLGKIA